MADQQNESPEHKRSKPRDCAGDEFSSGESPEVKNRRIQRELMAAAAEKRMLAGKSLVTNVEVARNEEVKGLENESKVEGVILEKGDAKCGAPMGVENVEGAMDVNIRGSEGGSASKCAELAKHGGMIGFGGVELSNMESDELFVLIFGKGVSKEVLAQWTNQGIRFSPDIETSMGLVQHEGGPCGVLAAIQAFVLKHLIFSPEQSGNVAHTSNMTTNESVAADMISSLSEERRSRALIRAMTEILFLCGSGKRAVIASLNIIERHIVDCRNESADQFTGKILEGLAIESGSDLQKCLRVDTFTSQTTAVQMLEAMLPVFRSRIGALLFLISALLSRGLDNVQADRDDPSQPLVTAPFGHASQEIVNLLLSGSAVANVFDGNIDLGGGMFVKGISTNVEVGFLTLLESLNFCRVGQHLKCPKWPIWVVGSESHYTVLFSLDTKVQEENEFETRESQIRRAFDAQDQSGGGGFISVEGFHQVIKEANISLPPQKVEHLCSTGFIVWSEFWQAILDLDKNLGGVKDSSGLMGKKVFDIYHFNGIAKSLTNNGSSQSVTSGGEIIIPIQRPRLIKLRVSVPPRWTPEEYMATVPTNPAHETTQSTGGVTDQPAQHAPLVDCVRTRWPRAVCNWDGDAPSIV